MISAIDSHHNKEQLLVSVIMNCFNGEKYLREAINSVLNQTHKNWELVIVNDKVYFTNWNTQDVKVLNLFNYVFT